MRIMIDTNVLISAYLFPSPSMQKLIDTITDNYTIVLSSYIIDELKIVVKRKFPTRYSSLDTFLQELPFELVYTTEQIDAKKFPNIRDKKDLPILASALMEDVDILITGDKDFSDIRLRQLDILTPAQFLAKY